MKTRLRQVLASTLVFSLLVACQGLAPYQALAGGLESQAPEPVRVDASNVAPGAPNAVVPGQGIPDAGALSGLSVETGLRPAAEGRTETAAAVQEESVGEQAAPPATPRERLAGSSAQSAATNGLIRSIETSEGGEKGRTASAAKVDFDHAGALKTASLDVDAAADKVSGAATGLKQAAQRAQTPQTRLGIPGRRYYAYETQRDYKITNAAKGVHLGSIGVKMAAKLWLIAFFNKTVAIVYGAVFLVIPPKLMVFLRLYSGIHLTFLSPAIARHAPILADRREVLAPHEELGQIPGVLRTIDVNDRHDSASGFSYFGSFLNRRVEKHQTLVMTDRSLPAEIRAQDGGLLGRLRELDAKDTLLFRAHTRVGAEVASWRKSVEDLFSGDVMDQSTAAQVRAGLDEHWLWSAAKKVALLAFVAGALGYGAYLPFEHLGIPGAHTYGELVGFIYFIVAGVFDHAGGPRIFRKYFFLSEAPQASWWTRVKGFLSEAWQESKAHHAHAVTVALETPAGEEPLGDIARGAGAHALAGNGLRRQLGLNSPYILGLLAGGVAYLKFFTGGALASASWPVAAALALGAAALLAYQFLVPLSQRGAKAGLSVRRHDGDGRLTTLLVCALSLGAIATALAVSGHAWAALTVIGALAAVVVVLDPFTSKGAAAYDARARSAAIPWGQGLFVLSAMLAAVAYLPASSAALGLVLAAALAIGLTSMYAGLKHVFNPRVNDVRTPRSTPELATRALSR